jgi:hypothetical protein
MHISFAFCEVRQYAARSWVAPSTFVHRKLVLVQLEGGMRSTINVQYPPLIRRDLRPRDYVNDVSGTCQYCR